MEVKVTAVVPARGGSKGIRRKNLATLCGKPLLHWTIVQLQAAGITTVAVSTDDPEIAELSNDLGAAVVKRPSEISGDDATSESAVLHAMQELALKPSELVVLAQATSPLRLPEHVARGVQILHDSDSVDSVFSAVRIDDLCLWQDIKDPVPVNYDKSVRMRRQESPSQFVENGSFYVFRAKGIRSSGNRLSGIVRASMMPKWTLFEIDEVGDLEICEPIMERFVVGALAAVSEAGRK